MKKAYREVGMVFACAAVLLAVGCGGASGGGTATIPECGFVMTLPPGWVVEDYSPNSYHKRGDKTNCWGTAMFCPMSGQMTMEGGKLTSPQFDTVSEFVKHLIEVEQFQGALAEVISQQPLKIGEVAADAHQVIYKANVEGRVVYVFDINVQMDNKQALQIYFEVSEKNYEKLNEQYPDIVKSIQLTNTNTVF